jgi:hypothetical protein
VVEILFHQRLQSAKVFASAGAPAMALNALMRVQVFNDRWIHRSDFRLMILEELLINYRKIGDSTNAADVAYRINVIKKATPVTTVEQRLVEETLMNQPKEPKNRVFYLLSALFVSGVFAGMCYLHPTPNWVPSCLDVLARLFGWAGSVFILAESMHGRAHGGSGPTAHFQKEPVWFSIRSGFLLCACLSIMLRLDQLVPATGYWQLPATYSGWAIGIGGMLLCTLLTYSMANVFSKLADESC